MIMGIGLRCLFLWAAAVVTWSFCYVLYWLWSGPWKLERALRMQGLCGNRYRFPYGDLMEDSRLISEARRNPMTLSHNIIHRVAPDLLRALDRCGTRNSLSFSWVGPYPRVTVMDPEIIKEVMLNRFSDFKKPRLVPLIDLLVTGIVGKEGEKWAQHRRIINPAFHVEKLKLMMPAFSASCDELISRWEELAGKEGSCELDVWLEFHRFTGDVISRAGFGSSYKEGKHIFDLQIEQHEIIFSNYLIAFIPGLRFLPTQRNRRMKYIYSETVRVLKHIIEKRMNSLMKGEAKATDLLGLLIESNIGVAQEQGVNSKNGSLTIEEVIEECKIFFLAGQGTSSALLTWTIIILCMHPNWQERARDEVLRVFGHNKPDFEGLNLLKIMTMILYEVLRLYPSINYICRQTYKEIALGEITFPPGVELCLPILLVHHNKEFWGEDADEFKPERFAEGISKATKNQAIFFPFGWGPRICIGQNFALAEVKMCLSRILQSFSIKLSPSYAHAPHACMTIQPQHGAQVILQKL